jgi:hypothetical protein
VRPAAAGWPCVCSADLQVGIFLFVTPAKLVLRESGGAGVQFPEEVDSRLRGNDVTFDGREPKV